MQLSAWTMGVKAARAAAMRVVVFIVNVCSGLDLRIAEKSEMWWSALTISEL